MRSLIAAVILAIILTWFALANSQMVTVSFIARSIQVSLSLVILISILIGVVLTGIISLAEQNRMLGKTKELENKLKHEEEILKGGKK